MGILYGHRCVLCGADFPVTTSRTLQLCPDCAAAVRREYRCNEVISIAGADGTIAPLYYRGTVRNAISGSNSAAPPTARIGSRRKCAPRSRRSWRNGSLI